MPTLKLHGFPLSNYYNIKAALLEAGAEFEDERTAPSQEDAYLAVSPMAKSGAGGGRHSPYRNFRYGGLCGLSAVGEKKRGALARLSRISGTMRRESFF